MRDELRAGLLHQRSLTVDAGLTVPQVSAAFSGFRSMPPVFATAYMVALVEDTCIEALAPYLEVHERTVGTHVSMSHCAATPVGMRVTAGVELIAIEGRSLRFRVECRDEKELIGAGTHERAVVDATSFLARALAKSE
jgi:fluoroacetyl-CoA thioesterase